MASGSCGSTHWKGSAIFPGRTIAQIAVQYPNLTIELLTLQQIVALSSRSEHSHRLQPPRPDGFFHEKLTRLRPVRIRRTQLSRCPFAGLQLQVFREAYFLRLYRRSGLRSSASTILDEITRPSRQTAKFQSARADRRGRCRLWLVCLACYILARHPELVPVLPEKYELKRSYWLVARPQRWHPVRASRLYLAVHQS